LTLDPNEPATETFEIRAGVRKTSLTEISVKNMYNTFAPYRCLFTADSDPDFSVHTAARMHGLPTLAVR
jgi:hypothetical protein